MVDHYGIDVVSAYMRHVQDNAAESVRRVIDVLKDGAFVNLQSNDEVQMALGDFLSWRRRGAAALGRLSAGPHCERGWSLAPPQGGLCYSAPPRKTGGKKAIQGDGG